MKYILITYFIIFLFVNGKIVRSMMKPNEEYNFFAYIGLMLPSFGLYVGYTIISPFILLYPLYKITKK